MAEGSLFILPGCDKSVQTIEGLVIMTKREWPSVQKHYLVYEWQVSVTYRLDSYTLYFVFVANSFVEFGDIPIPIARGEILSEYKDMSRPTGTFFGCQRQRWGRHDNPNALEFYRNTQALRIAASLCHSSIRSQNNNGDIYNEIAPPLKKKWIHSPNIHCAHYIVS